MLRKQLWQRRLRVQQLQEVAQVLCQMAFKSTPTSQSTCSMELQSQHQREREGLRHLRLPLSTRL